MQQSHIAFGNGAMIAQGPRNLAKVTPEVERFRNKSLVSPMFVKWINALMDHRIDDSLVLHGRTIDQVGFLTFLELIPFSFVSLVVSSTLTRK